jgi:Na+/phosphate symporter
MSVNAIIKKIFKGFEFTLGTLVTRIVDTVESKLPGRPEIAKTMEKVKTELVPFNDALVRVRKNAYTKDVEKALEQRATLFHSLVLRLESDILWYFDPNIQQNAIRLYTILEEIGKTLKKAQSEQSKQIELLFSKFDEQKAIIDGNGYTLLYDNLKLADKQLRNFVTLSTESVAARKEIPWLSVASDDLIDSLNEGLFKRLDVQAEDNENPQPFIDVINILNQIIDEAHKIQRARIARGETEDSPPEDNSDVKAKGEEKEKEELEEETATV